MIWPWSHKHPPEPSDEARQAVVAGRTQLAAAVALQQQVGEVQQAASRAMARNHFGAAVTAAMGGKTEQ